MKAFQLKIVINNSKPPIWRRLIVPAGITFSQFSMILNTAMGWYSEHLFDFKFENQYVRITEEVDEMGIMFGRFDCFEANKTFIREYLEENKNFIYTYDFGDNWKHKVTVEKIIEDYEHNYPQVLKYKGNCPPEDCGGIYGYYMLEDKLNNLKNQQTLEDEYEDWLEEIDYLVEDEYDINKVNEVLKERFFYQWGKAEQRSQYKIYKDHERGRFGLKATKKDENLEKEMTNFQKQKMENFALAMERMLKEDIFNKELDNVWQEKIHLDCLKDMLSDFTKEELLETAKEKGMKGISKSNKKALVEKIAQFMLQPEIMESYFSYLLDREVEDFEKLIKELDNQEALELKYLSKLYDSSYIGMLEDGIYGVSKDVIERYQTINTKEFEKKRKRKSYFLACLRAASILYGIVPVKIVLEMIKTNPKIKMTEQEIYEEFEQLPFEYNEYVLAGDKIYFEPLYPDDKGLLTVQEGKEYYIPTVQEIIDLGALGCLPNQKEFKKLVYFMKNQLGLLEEEAGWIVTIVQAKIFGSCDINEIFEYLEEEQLYIENQWQMEKLAELVIDLWNHTRMVTNRGFTPDELLKNSKKPKFPLREENNVVDFEVMKNKKIYPNELCPCGSGKKYKNCCGKK